MRLVGTTKTTIESIKERTHWNAAHLTPMDPVTLGLCSQIDLDIEVQRSSKDRPVSVAPVGDETTLLPVDLSVGDGPEPFVPSRKPREEAIDLETVFAKLGGSRKSEADDE
jgi:hypothetical protein